MIRPSFWFAWAFSGIKIPEAVFYAASETRCADMSMSYLLRLNATHQDTVQHWDKTATRLRAYKNIDIPQVRTMTKDLWKFREARMVSVKARPKRVFSLT